MKGLSRALPSLLLLAALVAPSHALGEDAPRSLGGRPVGYTDVADAFEEGHAVDVNLQLGYSRESTSGTVQREVAGAAAQDGRSTQHHVDIGQSVRVRNELALRLEVGVFHDVMVFARLPIVLSDDNELRPAGGNGCGSPNETDGCAALQEPIGAAMPPRPPPQPLFDLSHALVSARRSGVPNVDFGAAWAITNQYRDAQLPTWVLLVTGTANVGKVMRACLDGQGCNPGVSRGTARVKLESRWSYRYRFVEPFFGVGHSFEWIAGGDSAFRPAGKLEGLDDDGPPQTTQGTLGAALVPWEDRSRFQRFEVDLQGTATFVGSGRDFSPIFDALGTSQNPQLTAATYDRTGPTARVVPFTGITQVEAHTRLGIDSQIVLQAARYVRFALGFGATYDTSHLLTGTAACDSSVQASSGDPRTLGCGSGIFDPTHRAAIDTPERRFRIDGDLALRLSLFAMSQF